MNGKAANLGLKEVPNEGVVVPGLTQHPVHNIEECEQLLNVGSKNRMIGATLMNQVSSRSHCIFSISIEQMTTSNDNNDRIRKGILFTLVQNYEQIVNNFLRNSLFHYLKLVW